jgi:hypothetical protein
MAVRSKSKNRAKDKRRVRRMENQNRDAAHDITLGKACRRGWGKGIAK